MKPKTQAAGILFTLIFVFIAAVREIYFSVVLHQIDTFVLIVLVFSMTTVLFSLLQVTRLPVAIETVRRNLKWVAANNVATAVMWITFLYSLHFIEPAVGSSINSAVGPIISLALGSFLIQGFVVRRQDVIISLAILATIGFLMMTTLSDTPTDDRHHMETLFGLLLCILSGVATVLSTVLSKKMSMNGMTPSLLMATRFYVIIGVSVLWIIVRGEPVALTSHQYFQLLGISLGGIILPLYSLQMGIVRSDVNITTMLLATGPLVTFMLQQVMGTHKFSSGSLTGIGFAVLLVISGVVLRARRAKRDVPAVNEAIP